MKNNRVFTAIGLLLFFALCLVPSQGQNQANYSTGVPFQLGLNFTFTSSSTQTGAFNTGGIGWYTVLWIPTGTVSACTLTVDGAPTPGGTFTTGSLVASQTCTSAGSFTSSTAAFSAQGKVTPTITGTGSVLVYVFGYISNPASGGGGGTVTQGTAAALAGAWPAKVTDGTNGPAAVKAASTAPLATDPALVVSISPNSAGGSSAQGTAAAVTAGWPIVGGSPAEVTAAWTSGTAGNTTAQINLNGGYNTVDVFLNQGSTITGGAVTFEGSDTTAFTNAYAVQCVPANGFGALSVYTLAQSTNQEEDCDVSGMAAFRVRLSTVITGSATVNVGLTASAFPTVPDVSVQDSATNTIGNAVPTKAIQVAGRNGAGNLQALSTDASGNANVNILNTTATSGPTNITASQCAIVAVGGGSQASIAVTGTWTGTLQAKTSVDGTNYVNAVVFPTFPIGASTSTIASAATGTWDIVTLGATSAEVCGATVASGTAVVTVNSVPGTGLVVDNVALFGGSAVQTGTGASGAGVPRVTISNDSSLAANQSVNVSQFGGSNAVTGTGTGGAGIPRVTISNDSTEATDMSGTVPGTAPSSTKLVGSISNTAAPAPTNGQTLPLQSDTAGSLYVAFRSSTNGCMSNNGSFQSVNINASTTSAQQIVALSAGKKIYVCSFIVIGGGTSPTFSLQYGTGSNCATGTTTLMGAIPLSTTTPTTSPFNVGVTAAANALCTVLAGTSPTAVGILSYVQ